MFTEKLYNIVQELDRLETKTRSDMISDRLNEVVESFENDLTLTFKSIDDPVKALKKWIEI